MCYNWIVKHDIYKKVYQIKEEKVYEYRSNRN